MRTKPLSKSATLSENLELRVKLAEAANMLRAIRAGEADALLIESGHGPEVYTIEGREAETNRIRSEMLAQVSDAVIATDCEGRMTYLNAAAERLCGFSGTSALGRPLSEWLHPEDETTAATASREQGAWRGEAILITKDGRDRNIELSVTALLHDVGRAAGRLAVIRDVTEKRRHEAEVLVSEIRYRRLFEAANDGILILNPDTRKIVDVNPFMLRLLDYPRDQMLGKELFEIGLLQDEAASQEMFGNLQCSHEVRYENLPLKSRTGERRDVEVVANLYDENGHPVIQFNIRDITQRKRSEEHVKLLMAEVNHRAKNLLAVVQAFARQTAKYGDPATFLTRLSDRIEGLAAGQDLLVANHWQGVQIGDLVDAQLSHFKDLIGTRVLIEGPREMTLNMSSAQGIGMALHELATNAAKYGALSNRDGKVRIAWQTTAAPLPTFSISWQEDGGPKVVEPTRKGFGYVVIGRMVEAAVEGHAKTVFQESGISWNLCAPTASTLTSTAHSNEAAR
jgi:PAS domain S-box-containing protein